MPESMTKRQNHLVLLGVVACFVLSGFAALLYQTAWMRQFSLVFGTSELAVAAVLAAYMGGLSLGATLAARYVHRITRPVLFYGLLEAGIAISALAVPFLLQSVSVLYGALLGGQPQPVDASGLGQSFFYLIIAFLVLAIPTTFMGATLPLLTKYAVQSSEQIGSRVGMLYATNTLGAIGGTLTAGFLLLPMVGLNGTVWVGVAINLIVFGLAAMVARYVRDPVQAEPEPSQQVVEMARGRSWILPLMLFSGANSFIYEVLWTRLLGHVLGGSISAFATMLAGFLSGIAIGSAVASRFARSASQATRYFIGVQCAIGLTSMLIYQLLPYAIPETAGLSGNVLLAFLVLLPATIFIGATFPLAVRILATSVADAPPASARIYSWNTVGAIVGATAAAFFLIPALKYEGAIKFAVCLNALLALGAAACITRQHRIFVAATLGFLVAVLVWYQPLMPEKILRSSPVFAMPSGDIWFYEVGRSATVLVIEDDGLLNLRTNGLPEASATLKGSPPIPHNQRMLGALPVIARPQTESMLIIGLGGGVAIEGVPTSVTSIDVIELEPQVVRANELYADEREIDPLADPRVTITINDARSAMRLSSKRYDAIVSQPSHPWTAGASHLYTREFMTLAKSRLTESGVFLQWMNAEFVDALLLQSLAATLLDVFPYVRLYQWSPEVLFFLGSNSALEVEMQLARTGRPLIDDDLGYLELGVGSVEDLVVALAMDQANLEAFAAGGKLITDNNNYMATRSANIIDRGTGLRGPTLHATLAPFDPLLQPDSWLHREFPVSLNMPYIARRLEGMAMRGRSVALGNLLIDQGDPQGLVVIAVGLERQGMRQESQRNLLLALSADPSNQQARYALLVPWFMQIKTGAPVPEYVLAQLALLQGTADATVKAWMALADENMMEVAMLDNLLGAVLPSDLWYETSVKLRADWRMKVITPEFQPRLLNEATALIDSAIVFSQDGQFYSLRLKSTLLADDLVSAFETARIILSRIDTDLARMAARDDGQRPELVATKLREAGDLLVFVEQVADDPRLPAEKVELFEQSVRRTMESLQALALTPTLD